MDEELLMRKAMTGDINQQPLTPAESVFMKANLSAEPQMPMQTVPARKSMFQPVTPSLPDSINPQAMNGQQAQQPQQPLSFWDKTKNFLDSGFGRMVLGGLGTAAAVGLSGGNAADAFSYGFIGAGKTAENINEEKQRKDELGLKYQQNAFKPTEKMKNFEFIRETYGDNAAMDWLLNSNKGTNVTVNNGAGQTEFEKQLAKNMAAEYTGFQDAGRAAEAQLASLNALNKAIQNPNVYQGAGGDIANYFRNVLSSAGVDVKGLDDAAIINSGKSQLMGNLRKDLMPGPMSDRDIQFLVNIVPSLGKTREQNAAIINLYNKVYQRQAEAAAFVNDYVNTHGTWDVAGQKALREFTNRPIFTEEERMAATGQNAKESQDGGYGLKTETIRGGYRYIGGNPAFEKSWEII